MGTASSNIQKCSLLEGKQNHSTPKPSNQQEKPGSAVRVAQVQVPWAGLAGPGLDLGQLHTEKHQYDALSGLLYLNGNGREGGR